MLSGHDRGRCEAAAEQWPAPWSRSDWLPASRFSGRCEASIAGKVISSQAREWLIVAKTTDTRLAELTARIRALHQYQVPEIVALPITCRRPRVSGLDRARDLSSDPGDPMSDAAPSRWDDYLDVFVSPGRLFDRRSDGKFGHAMLVFIIAAAVLYFATRTAMQPIMDAEFARGMAKNRRISPPSRWSRARNLPRIAGAHLRPRRHSDSDAGPRPRRLDCRQVVGKSLSYAQGATIATFAMFPRLVDAV